VSCRLCSGRVDVRVVLSVCVVSLRRPLRSTLFPYTTLSDLIRWVMRNGGLRAYERRRSALRLSAEEREQIAVGLVRGESAAAIRSEEHTSELQSRENLVCRLLLEKKNKRRQINEVMTDEASR